MHNDISSKLLIEKCREEIIRRLLGIPVAKSVLLEEAQTETVSARRGDAAIMVTEESGNRRLVIIEVQTHWEKDVPMRLLEYRYRYMLKYHVEVISCVILLLPAAGASEIYQDSEVQFRFRLIRVYDLEAQDIMAGGAVCLMPLVPLMRHGAEALDEVDKSIYKSHLPTKDKADLLTITAIFAGLVSKEMAGKLISRRRDIMIESAAYEVIREIEYKEGRLVGLLEGKLEGVVLKSRQDIIQIVKLRFEILPPGILQTIECISDLDMLDALLKSAVTAASLDQFIREMDTAVKP
ncbi:MAG: hypothetical protein HQK58_04015 [Deltaproteobacteria bacterium]|nr:hypothetical protein [Deltaproteobacteria bacterium]MBF0526333.1 hypothetical protein [Deltaproteobacteria bacterium]